MKKYIFLSIIFIFTHNTFCSVVVPDYNLQLLIPEQISDTDATSDVKTSFSFKIGKIDGDISIIGVWTIRLGYGTGFTLYPEIAWLLTNPGMREGIIFEQKRLFALDWVTDSGIYLHLFFNDNIDDTEFTFEYTVRKFINKIYITNQIKEVEVNPYRSLRGGKAQDINFGFDWGNRFYRGRFDVQFDSVKSITDKFKGGKKEVNTRILSNQYERGMYYYLPDKNIVDIFEVYVSDPDGEYFGDLDEDLSDDRNYVKLKENIDFIVDTNEGFLKFRESVYKKTVLLYYNVKVNGNVYEVGDEECGKNGIEGENDFNKNLYPDYFTEHDGRIYLILSFFDDFSYFEEKNSYRIANAGSKVSNFNADIFDDNNERESGYKIIYDDYTGCLRITKSDKKGDRYNIYPFYDDVDVDRFYLTNNSPRSWLSENTIEFSCFLHNQDLKLSSKPIESSIVVYYNSILLDPSYYTYDFASQSIVINFEVSNTDIIEVYYLTDEEDALNLTVTLQNDFRLNKYFIIGDSFWYKMPIKIWEESYYFDSHAIEFLYFAKLIGDFHSLLKSKNAELGFKLNAGFSMYYPELKGITIVDDFEYELKGYKLNLNYLNWYPVDLPDDVFTDLSTANKGRLYYRNMHKYGVSENSNFISFNDEDVPDKDDYIDGARIGPYSSSDGFTFDLNEDDYEDRSNTLSLITEFNLDANEAVSIVIPISSIDEDMDLSNFNGLNVAVKKHELSGTVRLYIDAGSVTERYDSSETNVQEEVLDEGISYHITDSGSFYLYKGKNDGVNSTNDFDGNGLLDDDNTDDITKFINIDASSDYAEITKKYSNFNFTVEDALKLRKMRGLRLTLYSPTGSSGILMFNQLRFTESGWEYDKLGSSNASEISPIEDSYLLDNIFSLNNHDIDQRLHYQRYKERTMKINLSRNDKFYLKKKFLKPIDISSFKKFIFFVLLKEKTSRKIKLTMTDTNGNRMYDTQNLNGLSNNEWHMMEFYFTDFNNFNGINKLISEVKFEFINEDSDTDDNVIFIDEIALDDAVPVFGFGAKNEFIYSDPDLNFKKDNFSIFQYPYIKWGVSFNTVNFLINEYTPIKDYLLRNDVTWKFRLTSIDYYIYSLLDFIFRDNGVYNPAETLRLKIYKTAIENPFIFTYFYEYTKFGMPDAEGYVPTSNLTQNRNLLLEIGADFKDYADFKFGYDVDTSIKTTLLTSTNFFTGYQLNIKEIYHRGKYSIYNNKRAYVFNGSYSLDNLGYLYKDDFISFFDNGEKKGQNFDFASGFSLIGPIYVSHSIGLHNLTNITNIEEFYEFVTDFYNTLQFDVRVNYQEKEANFFIHKFSRRINNGYKRDIGRNHINWDKYFDEFAFSVGYISPIIFFPPFSSIYRDSDRYLVGESIKFDSLTDTIDLTWDWSVFIYRNYFLPYSFNFIFKDQVINNITFNPSYSFMMTLNGGGEVTTDFFRLFELNYYIAEGIDLKKGERVFTHDTSVGINFYTYKNVDIENTIGYMQSYTKGIYIKKMQYKIRFANLIYKNFFKLDYTTNDKYGVEISFLTDISSTFHIRLDNLPVNQVDNIINIEFTPKVGYRFNKNFTLTSITKFGYTLDYSQLTKKFVNRFGAEFILQGVLSF